MDCRKSRKYRPNKQFPRLIPVFAVIRATGPAARPNHPDLRGWRRVLPRLARWRRAYRQYAGQIWRRGWFAPSSPARPGPTKPSWTSARRGCRCAVLLQSCLWHRECETPRVQPCATHYAGSQAADRRAGRRLRPVHRIKWRALGYLPAHLYGESPS